MKTTNESRVELLDHMGSDLTVVNAARVSFDKESDWEEIQGIRDDGRLGTVDIRLSDKDAKLISYLARHNHWTPFAHAQMQFRVTAPIFVARQLVKHQVGLVWNEVSRRYVNDEPVFYIPQKWRARAENVKQGSSATETVDLIRLYDRNTSESWTAEINNIMYQKAQYDLDLYNSMLEAGVAPEQARMILPQNVMTSWYWTGSLMAFARVCKQRLDPHAQQETREVAEQINGLAKEQFPVSWEALNVE